MQAWLRFVLVWLIALALPAQGMASATMAHCGPSHERMHAALVAPHHHHAGAGATPQHDDASIADDAGPAAHAQHNAAKPGKFTELGKCKCGSCVSCCSAIALLTVMPNVPEPEVAPALFAVDVVGVDAAALRRPDRPPRVHPA